MIALTRFYAMKTATFSRLKVGQLDRVYYALELPDRGNKENISRIRPGDYQGWIYHSPRFGRVIRLNDKNGREAIELHQGNYPRDTQGCILPGLTHNIKAPAVWSSKEALRQIINYLLEQLQDPAERFPVFVRNDIINEPDLFDRLYGGGSR